MATSNGFEQLEKLYKHSPPEARICANCSSPGAQHLSRCSETRITPPGILVCSNDCLRAQVKNQRSALRLITDDGSDSTSRICNSLDTLKVSSAVKTSHIGLDTSTPAGRPIDSMPALLVKGSITADEFMYGALSVNATTGGNAGYNRFKTDVARRLGIIMVDNNKTHIHEYAARSMYEITSAHPEELGFLRKVIDKAGANAATLLDLVGGKDVLGETLLAPKPGKNAAYGAILKDQLSRRFAMNAAVAFFSQAELRETVVPDQDTCIAWLKDRIANAPPLSLLTMTASRTVNPLVLMTMSDKEFQLRVDGTDNPGQMQVSTDSGASFRDVNDIYASAAGFILVYE